MAAGMIVRDANNNVIVDTTTRISKVLGTREINAGGSLVNAAFAQGTPWFVASYQREASGQKGTPFAFPTVTFSGTTMTWTSNSGPVFRLTYGVY